MLFKDLALALEEHEAFVAEGRCARGAEGVFEGGALEEQKACLREAWFWRTRDSCAGDAGGA
eukprot:189087-Chlamydomonas_euryale.AAC.4